jgi:hypothetical protein
MDAGHAKAMLQLIIGSRQSFDIRAVKKPSRKVLGDVAKMLNGLTERLEGGLLLPLTNVCQVVLTNLCSCVVLRMG